MPSVVQQHSVYVYLGGMEGGVCVGMETPELESPDLEDAGIALVVEGCRPAPAAKMADLHAWRAEGGTKKMSL